MIWASLPLRCWIFCTKSSISHWGEYVCLFFFFFGGGVGWFRLSFSCSAFTLEFWSCGILSPYLGPAPRGLRSHLNSPDGRWPASFLHDPRMQHWSAHLWGRLPPRPWSWQRLTADQRAEPTSPQYSTSFFAPSPACAPLAGLSAPYRAPPTSSSWASSLSSFQSFFVRSGLSLVTY